MFHSRVFLLAIAATYTKTYSIRYHHSTRLCKTRSTKFPPWALRTCMHQLTECGAYAGEWMSSCRHRAANCFWEKSQCERLFTTGEEFLFSWAYLFFATDGSLAKPRILLWRDQSMTSSVTDVVLTPTAPSVYFLTVENWYSMSKNLGLFGLILTALLWQILVNLINATIIIAINAGWEPASGPDLADARWIHLWDLSPTVAWKKTKTLNQWCLTFIRTRTPWPFINIFSYPLSAIKSNW